MNYIQVRSKKTGQVLRILEAEFDPKHYDKNLQVKEEKQVIETKEEKHTVETKEIKKPGRKVK